MNCQRQPAQGLFAAAFLTKWLISFLFDKVWKIVATLTMSCWVQEPSRKLECAVKCQDWLNLQRFAQIMMSAKLPGR